MSDRLTHVAIFTDGACKGNPGPGGWGAILRSAQSEQLLKGATVATTNNRMELTAVIQALSALKYSCQVDITTDSEYVRQGITQWLANWKRNGWKTSKKTPVKNVDLWQQLDAAAARHQINWYWVKGHSNHPENELADRLANEAIDELRISEPNPENLRTKNICAK